MAIQARVKQYEWGWYIELYKKIGQTTESAYCNDNLISQLIDIFPKDYVTMLKENGAVDTANGITYFQSEEDALAAMAVVTELLEASQTMGHLTSGFVKSRRKSFTVL